MMVLSSLFLLIRYASRVYSRFRLDTNDVITGRFGGDEVCARMLLCVPQSARALLPACFRRVLQNGLHVFPFAHGPTCSPHRSIVLRGVGAR